MTTENTKGPQAAYGDYAFEQGVAALTVLSRLHGKAVAADDVRRRCKAGVLDAAEMLNCGRALGLRLRELASDWSGLAQLSMPAVGVLRTGGIPASRPDDRRPRRRGRPDVTSAKIHVAQGTGGYLGRTRRHPGPTSDLEGLLARDQSPAAPRRHDRRPEERSRTRRALPPATVANDAACDPARAAAGRDLLSVRAT